MATSKKTAVNSAKLPAKLSSEALATCFANVETGARDNVRGEALLHAALVSLKQHNAVKSVADLAKVRAAYYAGALVGALACTRERAVALQARGAKRAPAEVKALKAIDKRYERTIKPFGWSSLSGRGGARELTPAQKKAQAAAAEAAAVAAAKIAAEAAGRAPRMAGASDKASAPTYASNVAGVMFARPASSSELRLALNDAAMLISRAGKEFAKVASARELAFCAAVKAACDAMNAPEDVATPCEARAPELLLIAPEVTRDASVEATMPLVTSKAIASHAKVAPRARKSRGK